MPTLPDVLGFGNRWHSVAAGTAWKAHLPSGKSMRVFSAAAFIGTKLEAFVCRGQGDYLFSHDMGVIVGSIEGRETLSQNLAAADRELRKPVRRAIAGHLGQRAFRESLPGHLPGVEASRARLPGRIA